ncbi:MAG: PqqD family peptide modification chaperone [Ramlibacter sp.]|nr:PqqD family peptide modification chaperone [Ramlibacter sp.]
MAAEPLVSGSWYRVAPLKPSLAAGLKIVRHQVRDQVWHILVDPGSGRQLRLNPAAYAFAGRCNGNATVASLWQLLLEREGDDAPTQDDILRLLAQLVRAGMVQFDAAPSLSLLFSRRNEDGQRQRRAFVNPLMLRMKLFDPTRLLDRLAPLSALLGRWSVFALWLLAVALATLAAAVNFPQLKAEALRALATPSSYALAWIAYPIVKTLHEIAHAMAVRRFGGAVHELGISLVFLTPAPYVDASAANGFASARHRAIVSAAGIMVELALAALAVAAWLVLSPGLARDGALVVLLICSVSTLLFNANPLLRLDGYHLLCDALQLPNLALRSQGWWTEQWRRLVGGNTALPRGALASGELKWLVLYAPASWMYRIGLLFALVFWLGRQSWLVGWLAALALLAWLGKAVLAALLRSLAESADPGAKRRALVAAGCIVAGAGAVLFLVPAPSSVVARGVVWPPERAQLRAEAAGFVEVQMVRDGSPVAEGDVVLSLADPVLAAQRDRTDSEKAGLMAQQYHALLQDPTRAAELGEDLVRNDAELQRVEQQLADLQLRARTGGRAVWPRERDLPGSYAQRGAMLGYVLAPEPAQVRVVLRDEDLLRVRGRVQAIEVRLAEAPLAVHAASLGNETPAATRQLPSAALGDRQGGPVGVDPADKDGLRTQLPVFLLDVLVPGVTVDHIGGRAWVKLVLEREPLGLQGLRVLRQLLVRQFSPTGQT